MKKILGLIIVLFSVLIAPKVLAANVLTLEASESNTGIITVKGSAESSVMAVAINIYEEDGTTFITQRSVQVNDDNTFEFNEAFEAKKYVIKVADYDGGNFIEKSISPNSEESNETTPDTSDNVIAYIIIGTLSIILLTGLAVYKRKFN